MVSHNTLEEMTDKTFSSIPTGSQSKKKKKKAKFKDGHMEFRSFGIKYAFPTVTALCEKSLIREITHTHY